MTTGDRGSRALRFVVLLVLAASILAVAVACGADTSPEEAPAEGDAYAPTADAISAADVISDAGLESGAAVLLAKGDIQVQNITSDGYVAYFKFDPVTDRISLHVIPVTGGTELLLSPNIAGGNVKVVNFAVAFWTDMGEGQLGTFNVWTKAHGIKSAPGRQSLAGFFAAAPRADDGIIMFASNVPPGALTDAGVQNIDFTVTTSADLAVAETIKDVNVAANLRNCPIKFHFSFTDSVILAHCTGVDPDAVLGRLVLARRNPAGVVTTSALVDGSAPPSSMFPFYGLDGDDLNSKMLFVTAAPVVARVLDVASGKATQLEPGVTTGMVTADGGAVYYASNGSFKRASSTDGTSVVTIVDGGYDHTIAISPDETNVLFASGPGALTDLKLAEMKTSAQTTATIEADASVTNATFTSTGEDVVYVSYDADSGSADCHAGRAAAGGTRRLAKDVVLCDQIQSRRRVVFADNFHTLGPFPVVDVWTVDLADPNAAPVLVDTNVEQIVRGFGGVLAYVKRGVGAGLYTRTLP